jgi:hypothetical protein
VKTQQRNIHCGELLPRKDYIRSSQQQFSIQSSPSDFEVGRLAIALSLIVIKRL